jgi:hypothetical protein
MRKFACLSVLALVVVVVALATFPGKAEAAACYKWNIFPNERWVLDIKRHSPLVKGQVAFSVHGKYVSQLPECIMATVTGSIVTNTNSQTQTGAHLGMWGHFVRGNPPSGISNEFCFPVVMDCTAHDADPVPADWSCQSRNDAPVYHGSSMLILVPLADPLCNAFQDDGSGLAPDPSPQGPAGGMKP